MFPVQVYHRACTIGKVSMVSMAALVQRAGQVGFGTITLLSKLMGMASGLNMVGIADTAGKGTLDIVRIVFMGGFVVMSTEGVVCMETQEGTTDVVGTVGLADGGHSEYDTWQTLWVQWTWREWWPW